MLHLVKGTSPCPPTTLRSTQSGEFQKLAVEIVHARKDSAPDTTAQRGTQYRLTREQVREQLRVVRADPQRLIVPAHGGQCRPCGCGCLVYERDGSNGACPHCKGAQ